MKTEKQYTVADILNSLDGIQQAEPTPFLMDKIRYKLSRTNEQYAPAKLIWLAAASLVLLIFLNIQVFKKQNASADTQKQSLQTLADQYQLLNTNTINYN